MSRMIPRQAVGANGQQVLEVGPWIPPQAAPPPPPPQPESPAPVPPVPGLVQLHPGGGLMRPLQGAAFVPPQSTTFTPVPVPAQSPTVAPISVPWVPQPAPPPPAPAPVPLNAAAPYGPPPTMSSAPPLMAPQGVTIVSKIVPKIVPKAKGDEDAVSLAVNFIARPDATEQDRKVLAALVRTGWTLDDIRGTLSRAL